MIFRIKIMTFDEILASQIIIDSFLKAIIQFDNGLKQLNKKSLKNYLLMKDKYIFYIIHNQSLIFLLINVNFISEICF